MTRAGFNCFFMEIEWSCTAQWNQLDTPKSANLLPPPSRRPEEHARYNAKDFKSWSALLWWFPVFLTSWRANVVFCFLICLSVHWATTAAGSHSCPHCLPLSPLSPHCLSLSLSYARCPSQLPLITPMPGNRSHVSYFHFHLLHRAERSVLNIKGRYCHVSQSTLIWIKAFELFTLNAHSQPGLISIGWCTT